MLPQTLNPEPQTLDPQPSISAGPSFEVPVQLVAGVVGGVALGTALVVGPRFIICLIQTQ